MILLPFNKFDYILQYLYTASVTQTPLQVNETTEPVTAAPGGLPLAPASDSDLNSESGSRFGMYGLDVLIDIINFLIFFF